VSELDEDQDQGEGEDADDEDTSSELDDDETSSAASEVPSLLHYHSFPPFQLNKKKRWCSIF
jgi:hypothetical protein